jgi:multiple antibiotic resistance protein
MEHFSLFIAVFASLISVVNPLGAIPLFLSMTPGHSNKERAKIAWFASIYFFAILVVFFLVGTSILSFFGINLDALRIAGGLVILNSGYSLLKGKYEEGKAINQDVRLEALKKDDISFSPLAMPMLAGPGSISLLIGLGDTMPLLVHQGIVIMAVFVTALVVFAILRVSPRISKVLGVAGLQSVGRIMGFIVMSIGVQFIITGIVSLVERLTDVV